MVVSQGNTAHLPYVLITPARNEAGFIEKTIQSMIEQTVLPIKWVIVNDGSTGSPANDGSTGVSEESLVPIITLQVSPLVSS